MSIKQIAIMASGSGTNAQRIIEYFSGNEQVKGIGAEGSSELLSF